MNISTSYHDQCGILHINIFTKWSWSCKNTGAIVEGMLTLVTNDHDHRCVNLSLVEKGVVVPLCFTQRSPKIKVADGEHVKNE